MALDLSRMQTDVSNQSTVTASVVTLLQQLKAAVDAIQTNDPAVQQQLDALAQAIEDNSTTLSNAVVANTPAAPGAASR